MLSYLDFCVVHTSIVYRVQIPHANRSSMLYKNNKQNRFLLGSICNREFSCSGIYLNPANLGYLIIESQQHILVFIAL